MRDQLEVLERLTRTGVVVVVVVDDADDVEVDVGSHSSKS